jgi:hypothetical protein
MLDLFGIMFSSIIMFLVILRAVQLDTLQPWFRPTRTGTDSSGLRLRPNGPAKPGDAVVTQPALSRGQRSPAQRSQGQRPPTQRRDVTRGG